ncbi:fumarylacetoacetate hydrolase family protein [Candidatus Poriferisodalis multihospitum]|uniref:fumarylacetoacetate hydrolase family protein n=1 Tax=Candidatus Poriferisodalis multihospitum TaxID=2983191 RepID=UPI002B258C3F|nr:fumarylacetoacetate hydrolase family protein [Candidatus Poriferisodalis multihospitum]
MAAGKNFFRSGSMGPWITTADEIADPAALEVICRVNGEERQRASASEMIFSVAEIISYMSRVMPLEPGDVIATGSPEGTGGSHDPPRWLVAGDEISFEVPGIGVLQNRVIDE